MNKPAIRVLTAMSAVLFSFSMFAGPAQAAASKKAPAKAKHVEEKVADEPEPEIGGSVTTEYKCELGNQITVYQNADDKDNIALRWKKRLHRLSRIETTTGAQRFENKNYGLVWIGIPSKGMLLDSKQNRQLANECRTEEQMKAGS